MEVKKIDDNTVEITSKVEIKKDFISQQLANITAKIAELETKKTEAQKMLDVINDKPK
jgi:uncharacterized lipoprotein YehR (DUF1307 family)